VGRPAQVGISGAVGQALTASYGLRPT